MTIEGAPQEVVSIAVDGVSVSAVELASGRGMDPGAHQVTARLDEQVVEERVTLEEGDREEVTLRFDPAPERPPAEEPGEYQGSRNEREHGPRKALLVGGAVWVGAGVVGLALGGGFLANAGSKRSEREDLFDSCVNIGELHCPSARADEARKLAKDEERSRTRGATSLTVGGVALAAGITLLVLHRVKGDKNQESTRHVVPFVANRQVGLVGRF